MPAAPALLPTLKAWSQAALPLPMAPYLRDVTSKMGLRRDAGRPGGKRHAPAGKGVGLTATVESRARPHAAKASHRLAGMWVIQPGPLQHSLVPQPPLPCWGGDGALSAGVACRQSQRATTGGRQVAWQRLRVCV